MNLKTILTLLAISIYLCCCDCEGKGCKSLTPPPCARKSASISQSASGELTVSANMSNVSYKWSTGATTQTIPNPGPGTYTCTVTGSGNCSNDVCLFTPEFTVGSGGNCDATVTDIDGNIYDVVKIGNKCWTKQNLKTTRYNDGSAIPTGLNSNDWSNTTTGAYAVYNDSVQNETLGKFYNYYAVATGKLCPNGWHIPTEAEFIALITTVGGVSNGAAIKEAGQWLGSLPATNSSGFSAIPAGFRVLDGSYLGKGTDAHFWSSTIGSDLQPSHLFLSNNSGNDINIEGYPQNNGFSCRCVKD